jgi:predicted transposase YbfD/YdcC
MGKQASGKQVVTLILRHFRKLKDPRVARTRKYPLLHVLVMALCAALGGADGFKAIALFVHDRRGLFEELLGVSLKKGTPCTDTFRRVFAALSPPAFEAAFRDFIGALAESCAGQVVALDGKAVRGALKAGGGVLHLVHVWAVEQRLLLAQRAVEKGAPGEVGALPELIRALEVQGAVLTVDANGCTPEVARACHEKGADYVLALKGNRSALHAFVFSLFVLKAWQGGLPQGKRRTQRKRTQAHGRTEVREAWAVQLSRWPFDWPGLRSAVLLRRERHLPGKPVEEDWHLYVSSLPAHASRLSRAIRQHWGVENGLHWVLDVQMGEDRRRVRHQAAAENLALLTRLALTLLKRETSARMGIALKRQHVAGNHDYLLRVLSAGLP